MSSLLTVTGALLECLTVLAGHPRAGELGGERADSLGADRGDRRVRRFSQHTGAPPVDDRAGDVEPGVRRLPGGGLGQPGGDAAAHRLARLRQHGRDLISLETSTAAATAAASSAVIDVVLSDPTPSGFWYVR